MPAVKARPSRIQLLPKDVAELWLGPLNVARMEQREAVRNPVAGGRRPCESRDLDRPGSA